MAALSARHTAQRRKICIGAVSHRSLQVERADNVAATIRQALKHIAPEQLIVSSDCGLGRQGCNREIAFFKSVAIAQGTNIVRRELGLPQTAVRAADPALQTDIVPKAEAPPASGQPTVSVAVKRGGGRNARRPAMSVSAPRKGRQAWLKDRQGGSKV